MPRPHEAQHSPNSYVFRVNSPICHRQQGTEEETSLPHPQLQEDLFLLPSKLPELIYGQGDGWVKTLLKGSCKKSIFSGLLQTSSQTCF